MYNVHILEHILYVLYSVFLGTCLLQGDPEYWAEPHNITMIGMGHDRKGHIQIYVAPHFPNDHSIMIRAYDRR